ncbi:MAG: hypothetical protein UX57_C0002G0061 [Candidatus Uhrbacteria bacterium GW2011_GWE2_46_68]|uniref:Polymerase nucleotidyl transferase domain-containing protein n=2 Tax=Candidatus Uhriibacteriota TaxID=1752732 RepID=A0A0G1T8F9_9BACT|nr:MAG: hypothetical protein UX45_C0010G0027 [Candidatus Uhrbacteria bacterium GW2011_GWF2_46_218]KKU41690.1 MAG: hypothetical protein UX57_C0002G0061 [Candidatus Uhrbacteria bacterium GW2011_GWE2_46_68]
MGFLYTYDQVRRGEVPTLHDFLQTRDLALEMLTASPSVVTAGVMGSVAHGTPSRGSDLDLLTICRTQGEHEVSTILLEIRKLAKARHVMVDARLLTVQSGREGHHFFGPSFLITWRKLMELGAIIGPPPQLFIWGMAPTIAIEMARKIERNLSVIMALEHEHRSLQNREAKLDTFLRRWHRSNIRPLHFYIRLGRWLLWLRYGRLEDDRAASVISSIFQDRHFSFLHPLYREAHGLQKEYDILLERAIANEIPRHEYEQAIRRLALESLRVNALLIKKTNVRVVRDSRLQLERVA